MTDSNSLIKPSYQHWLIRGVLFVVASVAAYVVSLPQYNFAHWVPHSLLRDAGIPYSWVLAAESNADKILHPALGFALTLLFIKAKFPLFSQPAVRVFWFMCIAMLAAELWQWHVGRGFELLDLVLGVSGSLSALFICARSRR